MRSSTVPPVRTRITSGSASVRSLARNASYLTSFRSGQRTAAIGMAPDARHLHAALAQSREDLLGRREAEIRQHHDDVLLSPPVAAVADDERRGEQFLLLQPLMRVHEERAAEAEWEVVVGAGAGCDRRRRNAGNTVLLPGRRKAVPMHQGRHVELVLDADPELLSHRRRQALPAIRLADAQARCRFPVHLEATPLNAEDRDGLGPGRRGECGRNQRRHGGTARQHALMPPEAAVQSGTANRVRSVRMMAACTSATLPSAAISTQRSGSAAAMSRKPCRTRAWNNASSRS